VDGKTEKLLERRNQALDVAWLAKVACHAIAHRIPAARHVGGDDGPSQRRGLQKRARNTFVVVGGKHDAVGFFHRFANVFRDAEIVDYSFFRPCVDGGSRDAGRSLLQRAEHTKADVGIARLQFPGCTRKLSDAFFPKQAANKQELDIFIAAHAIPKGKPLQIDTRARNALCLGGIDNSTIDEQTQVIAVLEEDGRRTAKGPSESHRCESQQPGVLRKSPAQSRQVGDERDGRVADRQSGIYVSLRRKTQNRIDPLVAEHAPQMKDAVQSADRIDAPLIERDVVMDEAGLDQLAAIRILRRYGHDFVPLLLQCVHQRRSEIVQIPAGIRDQCDLEGNGRSCVQFYLSKAI